MRLLYESDLRSSSSLEAMKIISEFNTVSINFSTYKFEPAIFQRN